MLWIVTDLTDSRWLQYILEEFARINLAQFPIKVCGISESEKRKGNAIHYTKEWLPDVRISIPNRSSARPSGKLQWLSKEIFVIEDTLASDWGGSCDYDVFWNAFVFLSRLEEHVSEKDGKKVRSYSRRHPREDKSTFDVPVVNHLFDNLEQLIVEHFPEMRFGQKKRPMVELSHDVDYVGRTIQYRIRRTALNIIRLFKCVTKPKEFARQIFRTFHSCLCSSSYRCFDYWARVENDHGLRSIFYVYMRAGKRKFLSWFLNPSYDIRKDRNLRDKLLELMRDGFEVGLHGSIQSATDGERLKLEKKLLEEVIQGKVNRIRQHWLRYEENVTPRLHSDLFEYDSTLGWNDRMGFRSGCASRYRPYNHKQQKAFEHMETPQAIMDSNVFGDGPDKENALSSKATSLIESLWRLKTAHVSVSWHQRVCSKDYGWHTLYEKILTILACPKDEH